MDWKLSEKMLFSVLSAFAKGQERADFGCLSPASSDWMELFSLGEEQQILPVIYEMTFDLPQIATLKAAEKDGAAAGEQYLEKTKKTVVRSVIRQTLRAELFLHQYEALLAEGIQPVVIKGIVLRNLYKNGDHRPSGDEDIWVGDDEFMKAVAVFQREGYRPLSEIREGMHELGWTHPNGSYIELHRTLFGEDHTLGRELTALMEGARERRVRLSLKNGQQIWTLAPQDHFLYLILHAYKHFVGPGVGIRQVMDIGVFGETYRAEIDWQKLYTDLKTIRAEHFAEAVFDICRTCLQLPVADAAPWEALSADGGPLLRDMLGAGFCGNVSLERLHTATITLNQIEADRTKTKAGILKTVFPPKEKLVGKYPELKTKPWLLPVVWGKRLLRYRKETKKTDKNDTKETLRLGKERTELLKYYGIID